MNPAVVERLKETESFSLESIPELYRLYFRENEKRTKNSPIIIIHCEFSSKRGPEMFRFIRKIDRSNNKYPKLSYPNLFVLKDGYEGFYLNSTQFCKPPKYVKMVDERFKEELISYTQTINNAYFKKSKLLKL